MDETNIADNLPLFTCVVRCYGTSESDIKSGSHRTNKAKRVFISLTKTIIMSRHNIVDYFPICSLNNIIIIIIDYRFAGHEGLFDSLIRYAFYSYSNW